MRHQRRRRPSPARNRRILFPLFFVSRLQRGGGGVAQWNSRFLTIRITLPLFYSCFTYLPLIMCVRLMAVSVPCLAAAAAAGNVYLNVCLPCTTLFFCRCCFTKTEKKWAKEEGKKAEAPSRSPQQQTHGKKALLPSSSFCLLFFLCTPFVRENQPLVARPLSSFSSSSSWDNRFPILLPRLQTHSFLFCFSPALFFLPLNQYTLWLLLHRISLLAWALSTHAPTDCSWLTFFAVEKEREKEKELLLLLLLLYCFCPLYFYYI